MKSRPPQCRRRSLPFWSLVPSLFLPILLSSQPVLAADRTYCLNINYSAVPAMVNSRKLTLSVNVGTCSSVTVTADGVGIPSTYNAGNGTALFTTTGSAIQVTAVNWTAGGTGASTKTTLYNNLKWAFSLTLDDGLQSQVTNAKPLLDAKGWKAGAAVVGNWANTGGANNYMSWATVQSLRTAGWEIYNHSYTHPNPLNCANFMTELDQNETQFNTRLPGYNVNHIVFPYEVSGATGCAGFPPSYLISGEVSGGLNFVDAALPNVFLAGRSGLYGTDPNPLQTAAANASANARPAWMIVITHGVSAGGGAPPDAYATNANTLSTLLNYLDTNFGSGGSRNMWFAPSGEVMDYLFTRDRATVVVCTPAVTSTPTRTNTPLAPTSTSTQTRTATPSATRTNTQPLLTATPTRTSTPRPLRVMPLGDSLTAAGCWRSILWNRLQTSGCTSVDFVGTQVYPAGCAQAYDQDSEGHVGTLSTDTANQNLLPGWLSATNPDIVMMLYATNDLWNGIAPTVIFTAWSKLVDQMRANNPNMKILVGLIPPLDPRAPNGPCPPCPQRVIDFNALVPAWAAGKTTAQSPIVVVDLWTGFSAATDTTDGAHPNATGNQKLSDDWYQPLAAALGCPSGATSTPTASTTRTSSSTLTATPSHTMSRTASPSSTRTATPSSTASHSRTPTSTNSPVPSTATRTWTSTASMTATQTPFSTSTATPSRTATLTSTDTATPSPSPTTSRTSTSTASTTRTSSATLTASPTASPSRTNTQPLLTATPTRTGTPTATTTLSPTATASWTRSMTATPSSTSSRTASATPTASPTSTDTGAPTASATASRTSTSTSSRTATSVATQTRTATFTATSSGTSTASLTATPSPSATMSSSPTMTPTGTLPPSQTSTATSSMTATSSLTESPTASPSLTTTPSNTMTSTTTWTATPSRTSSPTSTDTGLPTASATASRTSTSTHTPSGTPSPTRTPTSTATGTATPMDSTTPTPSATLTTTATLSPSTSPTRTATSSPSTTASPTASATASTTRTSSSTLTATPSASPTRTATVSRTPTGTPTPLPTITATPTATVRSGTTPIVFPNPVSTGLVEVLPQSYAGVSDVTISVYTSAFKLVLTKRFPAVPAGGTVEVELVDDWGQDLADGIYYVAVTTKKDRRTVALIVTR